MTGIEPASSDIRSVILPVKLSDYLLNLNYTVVAHADSKGDEH